MKGQLLKATLIVFFALLRVNLIGQAPELMTYQMVVRDNSGNIVAGSVIGLRLSILQNSTTGPEVLVETHSVVTNVNGLISVLIGNGANVSGSITAINWSAGPFFLRALIDPFGGTNYTLENTSQLVSVPYSYYSSISGNGFSRVSDIGDTLFFDNGTFIIVPGVSAVNNEESFYGCTIPTACNYWPIANVNDGSCVFPGYPCNDSDSLTFNDQYNAICQCSGSMVNNHCNNGVWEPSLGEVWLDCGGPCPICPTCRNGVLDDGESGIDCGGDCGGCELLCGDGLLNGYEDQIDCDNESDVLQGGCEYCPTCVDGIMNGNETGIDCGGDSCIACCSSGSCRNGIRDGEEFYNDCGGNICEDCPDTLYWNIDDTTYYTPSQAIVYAVGPVITLTACQAFPTDPESPFIPMGTLDVMITEPPAPASWLTLYNAVNSTISFPNTLATSDQYAIYWTDLMGNLYSTAHQTLDGTAVGSGTFTIDRYDTIVIPDDNFDGCNKPAGTYTYYRIRFTGVLVTSDLLALVPSVEISGWFIVTVYVP